MATRLELQTRVQANLGRIGVTTAESTAVQTWIDQAIREDVCADHAWSGMEFTRTRSLIVGTDTYAFQNPTVFKDIRFLTLRPAVGQDYYQLQEITLESLRDRSLFTEQSNERPIAFARDADSYIVAPIPDATYPVREYVYEYPAALSADGSTNFATLYNPKLVEYGATIRAALFYGENDMYALFSQAYANELAKAMGVDRKRLSPAKMTIRPSDAAGTPEPGLARGGGWRRVPYDWAN